MFNNSNIMKDAWSLYRKQTQMSRPTLVSDRRSLFARCLKNAWAWAKQDAVDARKTLQEKAIERAGKLAVELMRLDARPWGMRSYRVADSRAAMIAEISNLQQIAAR